MTDAKRQAEAALVPEHEKILKIRSIVLQNDGSGSTTTNFEELASAPAIPVMSGQNQFSAAVTVVYSIGD